MTTTFRMEIKPGTGCFSLIRQDLLYQECNMLFKYDISAQKRPCFACALGSTRASMHTGSLQNGSKNEGKTCLKCLVLGYPLGPAANLQVADIILSLKNVRHMAVTVTNWNDGHVSQDSLE